MPGMNFRAYGGVSARPQADTSPNASSVTAAAFGPGYSSSPPSMSSALAPNDAFGVTFWIGVASIVGLVLIRHSLPH